MQVFWLSPLCLPSQPRLRDQWHCFGSEYGPLQGRDYSGGSAPDFNGIPFAWMWSYWYVRPGYTISSAGNVKTIFVMHILTNCNLRGAQGLSGAKPGSIRRALILARKSSDFSLCL